MGINEPQNPHPEYFTISQFCDRHEWATLGGIRHLVFHEHTNGFAPCVRRMGRRVLLDENAVFVWIDKQGKA